MTQTRPLLLSRCLQRLAAAARLAFPQGPFTAALYGDGWQPGPVSSFETIRQCRTWAIDNVPFADRCTVLDGAGKVVRRWAQRSGGMRWRQVKGG